MDAALKAARRRIEPQTSIGAIRPRRRFFPLTSPENEKTNALFFSNVHAAPELQRIKSGALISSWWICIDVFQLWSTWSSRSVGGNAGNALYRPLPERAKSAASESAGTVTREFSMFPTSQAPSLARGGAGIRLTLRDRWKCQRSKTI